MASTDVATRAKMVKVNGDTSMLSGLKHSLTNVDLVNTVLEISKLQTSNTKDIIKISEAELED